MKNSIFCKFIIRLYFTSALNILEGYLPTLIPAWLVTIEILSVYLYLSVSIF